MFIMYQIAYAVAPTLANAFALVAWAWDSDDLASASRLQITAYNRALAQLRAGF